MKKKDITSWMFQTEVRMRLIEKAFKDGTALVPLHAENLKRMNDEAIGLCNKCLKRGGE